MKASLLISVICLSFVLALFPIDLVGAMSPPTMAKPSLVKRGAEEHKHNNNIMHTHMSRKVFDRACAASKDTIDEIIACLTGNENLLKAIKPELAAQCYKDAFGQDFDPKDVLKHKEMICNNRDKFENMTACIYRRTTESLSTKEVELLTEAMVDVGMCIINALD